MEPIGVVGPANFAQTSSQTKGRGVAPGRQLVRVGAQGGLPSREVEKRTSCQDGRAKPTTLAQKKAGHEVDQPPKPQRLGPGAHRAAGAETAHQQGHAQALCRAS